MNNEIKIKEIRESKRIRQIEVADALNMDNSQYAKIEKRGKKLSIEQIEKIAEALGVSVIELLGLDSSQVIEQVNDNDKDKEIADLKKRVAELERMNILFEGNNYAIEAISRKLIGGLIEISFQTAMYHHSEELSESEKSNIYSKADEEYNKESKNALKELMGQGSFIIVLKKMIFEQKDRVKIILEWLLTDKLTKSNIYLGYQEARKLAKEAIEAQSDDEIINEILQTLLIPYFSK